jgi:hypothetical protein
MSDTKKHICRQGRQERQEEQKTNEKLIRNKTW